jgi:lipopolysaccharide/colanic/teichoic acid biosynthesis glycosyltransferase
LRITSLDELPQVWNVLMGDMSLVGPRPIVAAEIDKYADRYEHYMKVLPGITGLWQVSGRNNTTYDERVDLDVYYVQNWSLWLDVYILACTVKVVLLGEGAY